ncbi:hypothetical protein L2E82_25327 [Cichorium intybus]|uniref:Uncharacterized protein n=1 Tax=Cichorium intybus TaxID=13427 RepID=A0ACB9E2R3_CICIN|nr:hypothetical protein L2E82_25327 [Cichorium intybus]
MTNIQTKTIGGGGAGCREVTEAEDGGCCSMVLVAGEDVNDGSRKEGGSGSGESLGCSSFALKSFIEFQPTFLLLPSNSSAPLYHVSGTCAANFLPTDHHRPLLPLHATIPCPPNHRHLDHTT